MKRKSLWIVALICMLSVGIVICSLFIKRGDKEETYIYNMLIEESFSEDTRIEKSIKEEVDITINEVNEDMIKITVKAPDISEELIGWIAGADDDITDKQIEEKVLSLIQETEKTISTYELYCEDMDETNIQYTEAYMNAVSCGLYDFYNYAMNQVILEMLEDGINE